MVFTKRLREGVRGGEITCSVRIWTRLHVRWAAGTGWMKLRSKSILSSRSVLPDVTPQLARESGFLGIVDLLKVAKHGRGENIYLIRFHYVPPGQTPKARR